MYKPLGIAQAQAGRVSHGLDYRDRRIGASEERLFDYLIRVGARRQHHIAHAPSNLDRWVPVPAGTIRRAHDVRMLCLCTSNDVSSWSAHSWGVH